MRTVFLCGLCWREGGLSAQVPAASLAPGPSSEGTDRFALLSQQPPRRGWPPDVGLPLWSVLLRASSWPLLSQDGA